MAFSLAMITLPLGCDSKPEMAQVTGQVLIDGKPLRFGSIQVAPKGYRPAVAKLDEEGRFVLSTSVDGDGVVLGTHPVAVIGTETKGPGAQYWHAPKRYADTATSGLEMTIEKNTKEVKVELNWGNDKPFLERFNKE
jgi:hypothetical protein